MGDRPGPMPPPNGAHPGMAGGARPMSGNAPIPRAPQPQHLTQFSPTMEGFNVVCLQSHESQVCANDDEKRKAIPGPGAVTSWNRVKITPISVSAKEFAAESRAKGQLSVNKMYQALRTDAQREAVDRVLNDQRQEETNPNAAWELALIRPKIERIRGILKNATETTNIRVILKRQPRPTTGVKPVHLNLTDRIVDVSEPVMFPYQPQFSNPAYPPLHHNERPLHEAHYQGPGHPNERPGGERGPGDRPQHGPGPQGHPGPPPVQRPPPPPEFPPQMKQPNYPGGGHGNPNIPINMGPHIPMNMGPNIPKKQPGPIPPMHQKAPPNQPRKSMEFVEKVEKWNSKRPNENSDSSGSSDSDDSAIIEIGKKHKSKKMKEPKLPAPPMGHFASGALPKRSHSRSPPTILKRKVSKTNIRTSRHGQKHKTERRLTETRYTSDDSETSWDRMDDLSSGSGRRSYRTQGTSHSSGSYDERGYQRSRSKDRRRSRSRHHDPRQDTYRQHRKPSPYRGVSPRSSDSERERNQQPLVVHIHNTDQQRQSRLDKFPVAQQYRDQPSIPASIYGTAYPGVQRALPYPDENDAFSMSSLQHTLPSAPMVPSFVRHNPALTQQQLAAEEYMRSQERRNSFAQTQLLDATRRRDEEVRWKMEEDARRTREETIRLAELRRHKDELVERMRKEQERERTYERVARHGSYAGNGRSMRQDSYVGNERSPRRDSYVGNERSSIGRHSYAENGAYDTGRSRYGGMDYEDRRRSTIYS